MDIIGKKFTIPEFKQYVAGLDLQHAAFHPSFIVLHNTGVPDRAQYENYAKHHISDEQWAQNLAHYYEYDEGWSSGPHAIVVPTGVIAFTPFTHEGTHSPSWNYCSWGIETVGNYDTEVFQPDIRENVISVLGILHRAAHLTPIPYVFGRRGLHFHKEDPRTQHKRCPGVHIVKAVIVDRLVKYMEGSDEQEHDHDPTDARRHDPSVG